MASLRKPQLETLIQWAVLPFLLLALIAALPSEWIKGRTTDVRGPLIEKAQSDDDSLAVVGALPRDFVEDGKPVSLELLLSNQKPEPILALQLLSFDAGEGFAAPPLEVIDAGLPDRISPNGTVRFRILLRPRRVAGRFRITTALLWRDAAGEGHVATLQLGPVRVHRGWKAGLIGFGAPIISLYKDLALPVVVLLAGFLLQRWLSRLEESRRQTEQERSHIQTTWTQMLPTSHKNTSEYYLPAIRASGKIVSSYGAWKKAVPQDGPEARSAELQCFYYTMLLAREMKAIREKIGGAFLKSHDVEELVAVLWLMVNRRLEGTLGFEDTAALLMRMNRHEAFPSFAQRVRSARTHLPVHRLEKRFGQWLRGDFSDILVPLSLFNTVFHFEVNLPYSLWYEEELECPTAEVERLLLALTALLATKIAAYEKAVEGEESEQVSARLKSQCDELRDIGGRVANYLKRRSQKKPRALTRFRSRNDAPAMIRSSCAAQTTQDLGRAGSQGSVEESGHRHDDSEF